MLNKKSMNDRGGYRALPSIRELLRRTQRVIGGAGLLLLLTSCGDSATPLDEVDSPLLALNRMASARGGPVFTEGFVETDNGSLHYVAAGQGRPLIFYHGFPAFWYTWHEQLLELSLRYRVIALDGLGANLSHKPESTEPYEISELAAQLQQASVALLGDTPVTLIGHDWGGALVWSFAQRYPERVAQLAVFNAPPLNLFLRLLEDYPAQQKASRYVERLKNPQAVERLAANAGAALAELGYARLLKSGYISVEEYGYFAAALGQPGHVAATTRWYLANVPAPDKISDDDFWPSREASADVDTLLVWGATDETFIAEFLLLAEDYASPLQVEVLDGVGHTPPLEAPEQVNALLNAFLCAHDSSCNE